MIVIALIAAFAIPIMILNNNPYEKAAEVQKIQILTEEDKAAREEAERLERLSNPQIALEAIKSLSNTPILLVEGIEPYTDKITDDSKFFRNGLEVNLRYKFQISADLYLNQWEVVINKDTITLKTPYIVPELVSIEELPESYIKDIYANKLFSSHYKTSETEKIRDIAQAKTIDKIKADEEIWITATKQLHKQFDDVKMLMKKIGYRKVLIIHKVEGN